MVPDIERILSDYLRGREDVTAITSSIVGKPPSAVETPWVMVTDLDDAADPRSKAEHLFEHMVQVDCYAGKEGGQPEANRLYFAVRQALHEMPDADLDDVVVSAVKFSSSPRIREGTTEPARERRALTAHVTTHPR